jgi:translation initiation factor 2B subunit (eIF-2B alpha/beta/delta family)
LTDRRMGSSSIADRAARLLIGLASPRGKGASPSRLHYVAAALVEAHPAMALLHDLVATVDDSLRRGRGVDAAGRVQALVERLRHWRAGLAMSRQMVAAHGARAIPTRRPLLILSYSGTVLDTCRALARGKHPMLVVCESRPLCEGAVMARALARSGCVVTVITDAAMGNWIVRCGAVLLGADWIDRRGFVNKTGSRALSVLADADGVPVFVLADRGRLRGRILAAAKLPSHDPRQILTRRTVGLHVDNRYFERVEWMPSHRLITESGCFCHPAEQWPEILSSARSGSRVGAR